MDNFVINIAPINGYGWWIWLGIVIVWALAWVIVKLAAFPHLEYDGKGRWAIGIISICGGLLIVAAGGLFLAGSYQGAEMIEIEQALSDEGYSNIDYDGRTTFTAEGPDGSYVEGFINNVEPNKYLVTVK